MSAARIALLAALATCLLVTAGSSSAAGTAVPRVTIVADSVGGVLFWQREAREELGRGIELRIDIRTCRRLVSDGCVYDGERPPSALDAVRALGSGLGTLAVVDVGYNDSPAGYGAALDRVMRALQDVGVERVVWVTLRERRSSWAEINDEIRDGARRWPQIVVGEWHRESAGHDDWFADGIHMNWEGGAAFSRFLRGLIVDACTAACRAGDGILELRTGQLRTARAGVRYAAHLMAAGGTPPYRWSVSGLPRPLHVRPDGTIYGRPQTSGTYSLAAVVVDAAGIRNHGVVGLRITPRR